MSNQIQFDITDLHMIAGSERLVNRDYFARQGSLETRQWSTLLSRYARDFEEKY